ncbi:MAG: alanine dehydrogenase [Solirubrobacterales bacterium]
MDELSLGLLGRSHKENERRLPVHPRHVGSIDGALSGRILLERGYGEPFGFADEDLAPLVGIGSREEIFESCDVVVLPKPMPADLMEMPEGKTLCGWMHCVQDEEITQLAIDRRLTLIAWEEMHHRHSDGSFDLHVFHRNNELAGYCSVIHALQLAGVTGEYGRELRGAVVGFGATGRGAVTALEAMGIADVSVLTRRDAAAVAGKIHSMRLVTYERDPDSPERTLELDSEHESVAEFLSEHDVVVNCVLQDTDAPLILISGEEPQRFSRGILFVDVSADVGMGLGGRGQRPRGADVHGRRRDALLRRRPQPLAALGLGHLGGQPGLHPPPRGCDGRKRGLGLRPHGRPAIEIRNGVIQNPKILSFQGRSAEFPHAKG